MYIPECIHRKPKAIGLTHSRCAALKLSVELEYDCYMSGKMYCTYIIYSTL